MALASASLSLEVVDSKRSLGLLLIGAPGAGKSETLTRVHDDLDARGVSSAAIDADELARSYPPISLERHLENVRSLAGSFIDGGQTLLLVALTVEGEDELTRWVAALQVDRVVVVHLVASAATLEQRVRDREPAGWQGLEELVATAVRLADMRFARTDVELDTEANDPAEIARAVTRGV